MVRGVLMMMLLLVVMPVLAQEPQSYIPITPENAAQLELGYAIPGSCTFGGFSPDNQYIAVDGGVWDVFSGERIFPYHSYGAFFNQDGTQLVAENEGVYDVATGQLIANLRGHNVFYNADETLIAIGGSGVYDTTAFEQKFAIERGGGYFSPDSSLMVVYGEGVYDVTTGERVIEMDVAGGGVFSPDGQWLGIRTGAVANPGNASAFLYKTHPLQLQFSVTGSYTGYMDFSPDSTLVAIGESGVYDLSTGEPRSNLPAAFDFTFNQDGTLLAAWGDGVYNVSTGEKLFPIDGLFAHFTPGRQFVASEGGIYRMATGERVDLPGNAAYSVFASDDALVFLQGGVYETNAWQRVAAVSRYGLLPRMNTAETLVQYGHQDYVNKNSISCLLYGIAGNLWPYRSGIVETSAQVDVFDRPSGAVVATITGEIIVYARTADNAWLKILYTDKNQWGWIRSGEVVHVFMLDGIPIETP